MGDISMDEIVALVESPPPACLPTLSDGTAPPRAPAWLSRKPQLLQPTRGSPATEGVARWGT